MRKVFPDVGRAVLVRSPVYILSQAPGHHFSERGRCLPVGTAYKLVQYTVPLSNSPYTRRFLGGRQPLCGIGVTSTIVVIDRKSTRLNSSHVAISYAVF